MRKNHGLILLIITLTPFSKKIHEFIFFKSMNKSMIFRMIIFIISIFLIKESTAQYDRKYGIGIQIVNPAGGLSGKIILNDYFSAQAMFAFMGGSTPYPGMAVNSYTVRGIFRFTDQDNFLVPYTFLGSGILVAMSKGQYGSIGGSRGSNLAWHAGAGFEILPFDNFGFNIEYAYGAFGLNYTFQAEKKATLLGGVHYYFNRR